MINSKKKGNKGENKWFHWLRDQNVDKTAMRNPSSGSGIYKSDVVNSIDANFEVKTVKKLNLKDAWAQSCRDAEKTHATPYVVIHFDGMADDEWLVVMTNWDWAEIFKKSREPKTIKEPDRDMRYKLQRLIQSAKEVLKGLEE